MLQIKRGRVKSFNRDKGWGHIIPFEGGSDVFFHVKYFSGVSEECHPGELELRFADEACLCPPYRVPQEDDVLVYNEYHDQRGLMAVHWCFAPVYARAVKMVGMRPSPTNAYTRVMRSGTVENRFRPTVIWKGTHQEFREKLDDGLVVEMFEHDVYIEELDIASKWTRVWHPCNWHQKYARPPGATWGEDGKWHLVNGTAWTPIYTTSRVLA